jgi:ribosomal-protein-alanine N-acetyltransferase
MCGSETGYKGRLRLCPTTDPDLLEIISWIPDKSSCKLWAGPIIRFPLTVEMLKKDMGYHAGNTLSLKDTEKRLMGLGQILKKPENRIHLARIIISPEYRRQGFGEKLCRRLMEAAEKRYGECKFSLNVYTANTHAMNLYVKLGFNRRVSPPELIADDSVVHMVKAPEVPIQSKRNFENESQF